MTEQQSENLRVIAAEIAMNHVDDIDATANVVDRLSRDPPHPVSPHSPWETRSFLSSAGHPPHLLQRSLASRSSLLLLTDARFVVVLSPPQLGEDPGLLAGLLETFHGLLE